MTDTSPDIHARVQALNAAVESQPNVIQNWKPLPQSLGICGGMGPVAGAECAVDIFSRVKALPNVAYWEIYMYSDPAVESSKVRKMVSIINVMA